MDYNRRSFKLNNYGILDDLPDIYVIQLAVNYSIIYALLFTIYKQSKVDAITEEYFFKYGFETD